MRVDLDADAVYGRYRPWLYAAALYNLVWGTVIVLFPGRLFRLIGMAEPSSLPLWQVVGMFVLVYARATGGRRGRRARRRASRP